MERSRVKLCRCEVEAQQWGFLWLWVPQVTCSSLGTPGAGETTVHPSGAKAFVSCLLNVGFPFSGLHQWLWLKCRGGVGGGSGEIQLHVLNNRPGERVQGNLAFCSAESCSLLPVRSWPGRDNASPA